MPTFGFWNLKDYTDPHLVVQFIEQYGIDILLIAEGKFSDAELIGEYARVTERPLYTPLTKSSKSRVRFFSLYPETSIRGVIEEKYVTIKEYRPVIGPSILIAGVHLSSKLLQDSHDYPYIAGALRAHIDAAEEEKNHARTVVIGDFNMNPFEPAMVSSRGLNSVMDRRVAAKGGRRVLSEKSDEYFYNPMWKIMGDSDQPALGTYYKGSGNHVHYFWDTLDQVLIRPSLLDYFDEKSLRLVSSVGLHSLLLKSGLGINNQVSDHLPIAFTLNT